MAEAVAMAKLRGPGEVDQALGTAAIAGRFADDDLIAILDHQTSRGAGQTTRPSETHSLQPGTSAWAALGQPSTGEQPSTGTSTGEGEQ